MINQRIHNWINRAIGPLGAVLVLGATFGSGMAFMSLFDNAERQGLYTQIEATRASTERACTTRMSEMTLTYADPTGPTQRLITQLTGRVDEQKQLLDNIGKSCALAAQTSQDTQRKVATAPAPSTASVRAAINAAAKVTADKTADATRNDVNKAIIDRKLKK
jgi:hypothetical protein